MNENAWLIQKWGVIGIWQNTGMIYENDDLFAAINLMTSTYWNCNYICREAFLSRQQAFLLTQLQETKWLPVFRLVVLYETSHIHVQEYKNVFYMSSGMVDGGGDKGVRG
mgnify:CR=1 FL=1